MNVLVKNVFTIILFGIALAIPFASAAMTDPSSEPLTAYSMFINADWVVKSVMLLLLLASITSWSILLLKKLELNKALNSCADIRSKLILDLDLLEAQKIVNNLYVETQLITVALNECEWADKHVSSPQGVKERLAQRLVSTQAELIEKASYGVGILASIGSTAPFIGLLGTVWGIMNSFVGIAEAKNTSLAVVAPGIAEALLATAAGLLAAIPAVLFYNHFTRLSAHYKKQLNVISSDLMILASRYLEIQPLKFAKAS